MTSLRDSISIKGILHELCIEGCAEHIFQGALDEAFGFIEAQTCIKGLFDFCYDEEVSLVFDHSNAACWDDCFPNVYSIGLWRTITKVEYRPIHTGAPYNDVRQGWESLEGCDYVFGHADFNIKRWKNEYNFDDGTEYARPVTELKRPEGLCATCGFFPQCAEIRITGFFGFRDLPPEFRSTIHDFIKLAYQCDKQLKAEGCTTASGEQITQMVSARKTQSKSVNYENVVTKGADMSIDLTSASRLASIKKYNTCKYYSL